MTREGVAATGLSDVIIPWDVKQATRPDARDRRTRRVGRRDEGRMSDSAATEQGGDVNELSPEQEAEHRKVVEQVVPLSDWTPEPPAARRLRCGFGFHRWAYMGEALARSTPHIAYEVNQVCVGCRVLRFNPDAPGRPTTRLGDWRRKPKPDGGQIHA